MGIGLPPAPRWAWVAMIAGVVAIAVMLPVALTRGQVPVSESASDRTSAPGSASAGTSSAAETTAADGPPVIAVYGDSYSAGSDEGGNGPAGWPARLADRLDVEVRLHAVQGARYVGGSGGGTFLEQVQGAPEPDADVVVIFGSRNDTGAPSEEITAQAAATYDAVRSASPDADLVVIGPAWSDEAVPADTFLARDAVLAAAEAAGLPFVDPLEEGWFFGRLELIGADAIHPTDQGHAYLGGLIEPVLRAAPTRSEEAE
jgi:lysophospholipase L1-like esterase